MNGIPAILYHMFLTREVFDGSDTLRLGMTARPVIKAHGPWSHGVRLPQNFVLTGVAAITNHPSSHHECLVINKLSMPMYVTPSHLTLIACS